MTEVKRKLFVWTYCNKPGVYFITGLSEEQVEELVGMDCPIMQGEIEVTAAECEEYCVTMELLDVYDEGCIYNVWDDKEALEALEATREYQRKQEEKYDIEAEYAY